jgi:hypothetical protein
MLSESIVRRTLLMLIAKLLLLGLSQVSPVAGVPVPQDTQVAAALASVRVIDRARKVAGTGVVVGKDAKGCYILTASHLVDQTDPLEIQFFRAETLPRPSEICVKPAILARSGKLRDLVILHVPVKNGVPGEISIQEKEKLPTEVPFVTVGIGCSLGHPPQPLLAKVLAAQPGKREPGEEPVLFWEVEGLADPGRSGGPLIDANGFLIGICSGTNKDKTYYVHAAEIRAFMAETGMAKLIGGSDKAPSPKGGEPKQKKMRLGSCGEAGMIVYRLSIFLDFAGKSTMLVGKDPWSLPAHRSDRNAL